MQVPDNVVSGTVEIDVSPTRFPNVPCRLVYIQANPDNSGVVVIGDADIMTTARGLVLQPGDILPAMLVDNLRQFYINGANGDFVNYLVIR